MRPAIAYIRLSKPNKKGKPGIGLDAQKATIAAFVRAEGYDLIETFSEIETGKGADALDKRPQLAAAMKLAKKHKAPVIVAKLDRLSRDVHFISGLMAHRDTVHRHRVGHRCRSVYAAHLCSGRREGAQADLPADQGCTGGAEGAGQETRRHQAQDRTGATRGTGAGRGAASGVGGADRSLGQCHRT